MKRRVLPLAVLGATSEAIYLFSFTLPFSLPGHYELLTDMGLLTKYNPAAFAAFIASVLGLFLLYLLALREIRENESRHTWAVVVAFALLFVLTMALMYPITAIDVYGYIVRTRIFTMFGSNPFTTVPAQFPQDPFGYYIGGWKDWPTPYGPLFILLATIPSWLSGNDLLLNLLSFKAVAIAAYLWDAWLIFLILKRSHPSLATRGVLLFAWNPLVVFETAGNGHNDALLVFFVLLAVYLVSTDRPTLGMAALIASVLIKYITLLLVPLLAIHILRKQNSWRDRFAFIGLSTVASLALVVPAYAPFWEGLSTLRGFLGQADIFISSVPSIITYLLQKWVGLDQADFVAKALTGVAFLAIYLWRARSVVADLSSLVLASFDVLFYYLIIACTQFESWYLIWPIALAALTASSTAHERIHLLAIGAMLGVAVLGYVWPWTGAEFLIVNVMAVSALFAPLAGLEAYRWGWRRSPAPTPPGPG